MNSVFGNINRDDLKRMTHDVLFENNTSGTALLNKESISILEFFDNGIILSVPNNSCQVKHTLTLYLYYSPITAKISRASELSKISKKFIMVVGTIVDKEKIENTNDAFIKIEFNQFDKLQWEQFLMLYEERQDVMNKVAEKSRE